MSLPQELLESQGKAPFVGRLGYACLNTYLRKRKKQEPIFCSRTCRIDTIKQKGMDYVKSLGLQNTRDLCSLIEWNEENNIRFMRVSSEMFPFASHDLYGYSLEYASSELKKAGELAKRLGHRLTTHPGQYTQLASPNTEVVRRAVADLTYHAEMLDLMGLDQDSVMIIHMGGVYGDKEATLKRFEEGFAQCPASVRNRLVLENDEICYSAEDILPVCEKLSIPLVFDWHHHSLNPGNEDLVRILSRIKNIWSVRGIKQKQHYSEGRPGASNIMEKRAHSDRVKSLPPCERDMDLMIEAKDKEQAVLELYLKYDLFPVNPDVLKAPEVNCTTQTKGRKATKPRKPPTDSQAEPSKKRPERSATGEGLIVAKRTRKVAEEVLPDIPRRDAKDKETKVRPTRKSSTKTKKPDPTLDDAVTSVPKRRSARLK
ncbi:UV-endonuclease UvdE [Basidiobolus meristosporus CBS 931.73]|uniref:UV-endonuclease UvdE n=1 Tax=Basidiobolus meristosporus CBS 931.73 TaxID=1314790 RepID=A0A1Y1Y730_9FUNG|nr:UV-endonuclease UvdE [Basidiobolus meristosporus CBS 931.73]|eukprot:ORX93779.1 UV-endonuclease UvdE [Basidiobolus meristosporus CBS 931.73]